MVSIWQKQKRFGDFRKVAKTDSWMVHGRMFCVIAIVSLDPRAGRRKLYHLNACLVPLCEILLNYAEAMNEWKVRMLRQRMSIDGTCSESQVRDCADMKHVTENGERTLQQRFAMNAALSWLLKGIAPMIFAIGGWQGYG